MNLCSKRYLQLVIDVGVNFEGRGQDSVLDARGEDVTRQGDGAGIGAVECRITFHLTGVRL